MFACFVVRFVREDTRDDKKTVPPRDVFCRRQRNPNTLRDDEDEDEDFDVVETRRIEIFLGGAGYFCFSFFLSFFLFLSSSSKNR